MVHFGKILSTSKDLQPDQVVQKIEFFFVLDKYGRVFCLKPIGSMYGILTYIWLKVMVNVGTYSIHGAYGKGIFLYF